MSWLNDLIDAKILKNQYTKKLLRHQKPRDYTQIKQHTLTSTSHEIPPSLTLQNKPQTPPISPS